MTSRKLRSRTAISGSLSPINQSNVKLKQTKITNFLESPSNTDCEIIFPESVNSTQSRSSSSSSSGLISEVTPTPPTKGCNRLKKSLNNHKCTYHCNKTFKCKLCSWTTPIGLHLTQHMKRTHGRAEIVEPEINTASEFDKTFKCSKCDFRAAKKQQLDLHNCSHETEKIYSCSFSGCDYRTKSAHTLREHVKRHEVESKKEFQCPLCSKLFWTRRLLHNHISYHTKEKVFSCSQCNFTTCYAGNLSNHIMRRHTKKSYKTTDEQNAKGSLGVAINDPSILTSTTDNSSPDSSLNGVGKILQKAAKESRPELDVDDKPKVIKKQRKSQKKILEKKHKCDQCDFRAVYKCKIIRHAVVHRDPDDKIYSCSFAGCDFKTNWEDYVKTHCREVHKSTADHFCPVEGCNFQTKWKYTLTLHQKKHERRKRSHLCPMCLKVFYDSRGLKRHINTHTKEKKYKCSLCDYVSGESSNFYAHRRKYHAGQEFPPIKVL